MPELPDLEVFVKNLKRDFLNCSVVDLTIYRDKKIYVEANKSIHELEGDELINIYREGKEVWFGFANKNVLAVHLMLKGLFFCVENDEDIKYKTLSIRFSNNYTLVMADPMNWLKAIFNPNHPGIPDALAENFTYEYLKEKLSKKRSTLLKAFLMDQNIVRGIGNAYSDEILWDCRISPKSKCGAVPDALVKELYNSINKVLINAIDEIEKATPNAISGEYRDFLAVHNKTKDTTPTGYKIMIEKIASRTTYFTEEQILYE